MKFSKYPATEKLTKLAQHAPDLTKPNAIDGKRAHEMVISALSWKMLYATERVNHEIQKALCELATQAKVHEKMERMQSMEIMNFINHFESEKRKVGHTAIRNPNLDAEMSPDVKNACQAYQTELKKLSHFLSNAKRYKTMVVIGIGGSFLGTKAVFQALKTFSNKDRELFFASNIDPDKLGEILEAIDLKTTLVAVVSKSGGTLEIEAQMELMKKHFERAKLDVKEHFVMVTGKGSPMDIPSSYFEIFYMWDFIGGRYSVSSMVGALPIAFMCGMDVWTEFLNGMHDMDEHALNEKDPLKNLPLWGALLGIWNRNFLSCDTYAIIPYAQALDQYSLHLQQLFMESNGKKVLQEDGSFIDWDTCPVIWGTVGTEGQHSYYQAIHQGTKVIPLEFIGFKNSQLDYDEVIDGTTNQEKLLANMFAQALALAQGQHNANHNKYFEGNRPSHCLIADHLDPYSLGNLLAYHEHYVAYQGWIWGVNSFDQEGVQLGKVLANNIIELYKQQRKHGYISPSKEQEAAISFLDLLSHTPDKNKRIG